MVESPFAALRLRTDAAKRFKKAERVTAVIWKMLMVAEKRFRWLNAPELLAKVHAGGRHRGHPGGGRRLSRFTHLLIGPQNNLKIVLGDDACVDVNDREFGHQ